MPIGPHSATWETRAAERTVLAVVHNVTSLTRLLDVLTVFESDSRTQIVYTWTESSPFTNGVVEAISAIGGVHIPWEQAIQVEFDLAVSASQGGDLHELQAPLLIVGHGMGYNKYSPRNTKYEIRNTKYEIAGQRGSFGLGYEQLVRDGRVIASAFILSHDEQLARLALACPPAVEAAVVAGDPCFDRMLASRPRRAEYRAALGVRPDQRLVVVSSTWGRGSLFGSQPELISRVLGELPADSYRVLAVLHPNIWHGHGPWQVRTWLADALRSGLLLVPPMEGWRAALVAADCVIGDHGSTTFYGAALGLPVLLAAFPADDVDPASPVGQLGEAAARLSLEHSILDQVDEAVRTPFPHEAITAQTTSCPGESAQRLRAVVYELLKLPEPLVPPVVAVLPEPQLVEGYRQDGPLVVRTAIAGRTVAVRRLPAAVLLDTGRQPSDAHLVFDESSVDTRWAQLADVVIRRDTGLDWIDRALHEYPGADVAAVVSGHTCVARVRDEDTVELSTPEHVDPAVYVSAVYAWWQAGRPLAELPSVSVQLD